MVFSAQSKSEGNTNKTNTRTLGNQVIRKGNLSIQNLGIMKGELYFLISFQRVLFDFCLLIVQMIIIEVVWHFFKHFAIGS